MSEMFVVPEHLAGIPDLPPMLVTASELAVKHRGLTVGRWLAQLTMEDLDGALALISAARHTQDSLLPWMLFAVLLANGEGMPVTVEMNLGNLVRKLVWLLQVEMLRREGHVELDLDQVSLETFEMSQVRTRAPLSSPDGPAPLLRVIQVR